MSEGSQKPEAPQNFDRPQVFVSEAVKSLQQHNPSFLEESIEYAFYKQARTTVYLFTAIYLSCLKITFLILSKFKFYRSSPLKELIQTPRLRQSNSVSSKLSLSQHPKFRMTNIQTDQEHTLLQTRLPNN